MGNSTKLKKMKNDPRPEITTRRKAIEWWSKLSIVQKAYKLSDAKDKHLSFFEGRKVETLTGSEVEILWNLNCPL